MAGLIFVLAAATVNAQTNLTSRPVGFLRVPLNPHEYRLLNTPFLPLDASNAVLLEKTGDSTNTPDRVFFWDSANLEYIAVSLKDLVPEPGSPFFIRNPETATQTVFVAGEVVTAPATNETLLPPGLNAIAYPYSTAFPVEQSGLPLTNTGTLIDPAAFFSAAGNSNAATPFALGRGYWLYNTTATARVWLETRPYGSDDLFPDNDGVPSIGGIKVAEDGRSVALTIACSGGHGEKLDIFYQDLCETGRFNALSWKIAQTEIPAAGKQTVEWTDTGGKTRPAVNEVYARFYLAGSSADFNGNSIPDARELFVLGTLSMTDAIKRGNAQNSRGSHGDSQTHRRRASTNDASFLAAWKIGKVIWVDGLIGRDSLSGRLPVVVGKNGPKKTIASGLRAATNETLIIKTGNYGEHLNISGNRKISVQISGKVDLRGRRTTAPVSAVSSNFPAFPAVFPASTNISFR